jgi:riboflavin synthase
MSAGSTLTCASIFWLETSRVPYRKHVFTGIVEEMGTLVATDLVDSGVAEQGRRLVFSAASITEGVKIGDSIAVNGCCLTVVDLGPGRWAADAVPETLGRTNLGALRPGDPVNLERAAALGDRLGGHLVQGHVDAVGCIAAPAPALEIELPGELSAYLVEKGSVTVDGISLTVVSVTGDRFSVAVIPHTMAVTTLGRKAAGDPVNIEVDVIAKYAARLLQAGFETPYRAVGAPGAATTGED